jgi:signal transduction histidine kinase
MIDLPGTVQPPGVSPAAAELVSRVDWLIRLRWLAVVGVACFFEVARRVFPVTLELLPLYATLAALAVCNLLWMVILGRLQRPQREVPPHWLRVLGRLVAPPVLEEAGEGRETRDAALFASLQIAVDMVLLATLLHFAGGIENPFIVFFIFHVIIASLLLSGLATYAHATLGLVLVAAVTFAEKHGVLRHWPLGGTWGPEGFRDLPLVIAQLFVLGATLFLSAYMGTTIAGRMRRREQESLMLSRELATKAEILERICNRLEQSERARSRYMRKVAHELRGPLGTIQTALKVVLADILPPSARDMVSRAERRTGELAQVTQDLLALSRARDVAAETALTEVPLAELVREVAEEQRPVATRAGVTLEVEVTEPGRRYRADPQGIEQLLRNLLANAIRYTPKNGRIGVRLSAVPAGVRLEVTDTGIGIPEEALPRLFEEFYRAENAREVAPEGSGLGLAIVRAVAGQHGGYVTVASELGRGTTFTVELPLEPLP